MRFQNPQIASKYRSTLHAFFTIIREERIRGLYRGIAAPLVRTLTTFHTKNTRGDSFLQAGAPPLNGLVFSTYRSLMRAQLDDENATPTLTQINLAGAGTGIISSYVLCVLRALIRSLQVVRAD